MPIGLGRSPDGGSVPTIRSLGPAELSRRIDAEGDTTGDGIHLGAMASTIDIISRWPRFGEVATTVAGDRSHTFPVNSTASPPTPTRCTPK